MSEYFCCVVAKMRPGMIPQGAVLLADAFEMVCCCFAGASRFGARNVERYR